MYGDENLFDMDSDLAFDSYLDTDTQLYQEEETTDDIQGYVYPDELVEQLAIVQTNQQVIINNLSYQSNVITFGFVIFVGVLVMKCLLHFFN